jgi:hypothetical protein
MLRRLALLAALTASCGDDSGLPDARVIDGPPDAGTLSLSWTLADGGTAVTCDQVGAVTVTLSILPMNAPSGFTEPFTCGSARGTSGPIAPGQYTVTISLAGAAGTVATVPARTVTVTSGQDTSLGAVAFEVDATGGLRFLIDADGVTSNCGAAPGGAAIEATHLELRTLDEVCVPTTFAIAAGATRPAGTYVSDCGTPTPAPCLDEDQIVSVAQAASGRFRLVAQGLIDGTACWEGTPFVRVPAGGATGPLLDVSLVRTGAAGCPAPP